MGKMKDKYIAGEQIQYHKGSAGGNLKDTVTGRVGVSVLGFFRWVIFAFSISFYSYISSHPSLSFCFVPFYIMKE